ncbi:MAG: exodeoxyribonuclease VII large subunit, partial [Devosia sp.]|nr:exodeoxyribonuclease VII large subunit [Devosia sp.]
DRLRAAAAHLPRPLDLLAVARQRLDHAATNLFSALRHSNQAKSIQFGRTAQRLAPQLLRQRARDLRTRLEDATRRAPAALENSAVRSRLRFDPVARRLDPALAQLAAKARLRLDPVAPRLAPAYRRLLEGRGERLGAFAKLLASLSYKGVLARGFALVKDAGGQLVRTRALVEPGDALTIEFADGEIEAMAGGPDVAARKRPKPAPPTGGEQESLF